MSGDVTEDDTTDEESSPEPTLAARQILGRELENALKQIRRPASGLFVSAIAAGLNVSFGALLMGMALTFSGGFESSFVTRFVLANVSTVGFVIVIIGQTELFTAHTTLGVLPVIDRRASITELGELWGVVLVGNLIGCAVFAGFIAVAGPPLGIVTPAAAGMLADALLPLSWWAILLSGVIAGWLMGLATWLVAAGRDTIGQVVLIWMITGVIGFGPFHHALLGTTELLSAMFRGQGISIAQFVHFLLWTTVGNAVGGTVFVALLNYGQAIKAGEPGDVDVDPESLGKS
ncbi:formate/nitrite transporter family protein [Halococcus dombrowskii]|uniref:Formate/nitrite transporter family protein n=1 Tax=Halococcus dombrowskii TaxID=179637 RepID=A0AAV3SIV7_HALDO|nr:formate/nitrite transporter family protein [Halococcus dombrowskii]UOO95239.1 formate/nitrite transporter family protein [Halococcus dombrowskii]